MYHVYGVGNALVDTIFEVSEDFLKDHKIDKGHMTLVDEARQKQLLKALWELDHSRACGGSCANTLIGLTQLGGQAFYSCKVGLDETGDFFAEDLKREGVTSNIHAERLHGTTGICFVLITPDAERTMLTHLGITETFSIEEVVEEELKKSKYLYIEGYLVASPTGKIAATRAREMAEQNSVLTSLTFSDPNMVKFFKPGLIEMLGPRGVDLLFCNREEALEFAQTSDLEVAKEEIKKVSRSFAITTGADGALLFDGKREIHVPGKKVNALDTNGAGDSFAGAFLYGINHGRSFEEAGKMAIEMASKVVSKVGPRLNSQEASEVKKALQI